MDTPQIHDAANKHYAASFALFKALCEEHGELPPVGRYRFPDIAQFLHRQYHCVAPAVEAVTTAEVNGTAVSVGSGTPVSGEKVVLNVHTDGNETITWPTGFTEQLRYITPVPNDTVLMADKTAGGSEPANYTLTISSSERAVLSCVRLSHGSGTPVFQQEGGGQSADDANPPQSLSITTTAADTLVFTTFVRETFDLTTENTGYPTSWTGDYALKTAGPGATTGGLAHRSFASAGATGTATWDAANFTNTRTWQAVKYAYEPPSIANPKGPLGHPLHGPFGGPV